MSTVRDIIIESASRANVCPRKRALPEDIFVGMLNLLNGVIQDLSNQDYLVAYQEEVDFNPTKEKILLGPDAEADDVQVDKLQTPKKAFYKTPGMLDWCPMEFISYNQFYSCTYSDYIVSWKPIGLSEWEVLFKPRFIKPTNYQVKLIYNQTMELKDDDVINLPVPYVELITRKLAYAAAVKWPRADEAKKNSLREEADSLARDLKAANASNKIITREGAGGESYMGALMSGSFVSARWC
jgi:hypothetical protein